MPPPAARNRVQVHPVEQVPAAEEHEGPRSDGDRRDVGALAGKNAARALVVIVIRGSKSGHVLKLASKGCPSITDTVEAVVFLCQGIPLDSRPPVAYLTLDLPSLWPEESSMAVLDKLTTTVSTKGQVILPKAVRQALRWHAGTRLMVESTADGVLLKPEPAFAATRPEDVFGCLAGDASPRSLADMEAGILEEARRRHACG